MKQGLGIVPKTERDINKIRLETYVHNLDNNFDRPVDEIIEDLKVRLNKEYEDHTHWLELDKNDFKKFEEIEEIANQTGHSIHQQMFEHIQTARYIEDELIALYEMKIIYTFKHLEINLKNLISTAYNDKSVTKSYKWWNLNQYLKNKNIDLKKVNSYNEINQLRILNNSIKHSNNSKNEDLKSIPEFKSNSRNNYKILEKFYDRIKTSNYEFIQSLSSKILKELYEYDVDKIQNIAKELVLKMDKKQTDLLIEEINRIQK
ncbi:hypothetical protein [Tenacibaculum piscium]|uniref:hypothetical protein n=1 Tax=Tenacibaculum piscium TaxID=1458515 RepID=UPI001F38B836|nr:hypothetical protein [Tenacibaculum piscium]